jgi:hypothetical protein
LDKYTVALGLALLLSGSRLRAAPPEPLTVSLTECPTAPVGVTALLSAIQLELDPNQRPILSRSEARAAIAVRVDCGGKVSIRIDSSEEQREVEVDDVPPADRPRAIALVVAELVRTGGQNGASPPHARDERATVVARENTVPLAASPGVPVEDGLKPWICAWTHMSSGAANAIYGGAAGIGWHRSRVQLEFGLTYAERARGNITAGLAAARYRHSIRLVGKRKLTLNAALSSAAGVTWAIGASETPGVVVRRVLSPYADARVEVALELRLADRIRPEFGIYSGGAVGLLATDVGRDVLSSGGWLLGTGVGSTF